jgi:NhaP-type Na+/H+ and K+/H+ antiporter
MAAGSEGIGGLWFEDYALTFRVGTVALTLIRFDGGLNTSMRAVREAVRPAAVLATVGVVATAAVVGTCARLLGASWAEGMLLGAIVSSTDAAAVFAVLRNSGLVLKPRVGVTLELESGLNDPVAVILTMAFTGALVSGEHAVWPLVVHVLAQLAIGACWARSATGALLRRAASPTGGPIRCFTAAGRVPVAHPDGERFWRCTAGRSFGAGRCRTASACSASTTPSRGSPRWRCSCCSDCSRSPHG